MAGQLFFLLTLLIGSSLAQSQSLLDVLRREGFTEYATFLEGGAGVNLLNSPLDLIIYAPTNAGFLRYKASPTTVRREISDDQALADCGAGQHNPGDTKRKKRNAVCSEVAGPGAQDIMTLLDDPEFVNLPPNNNASIVEKNMPKGALPVVHSGLGDVVKVVGLDIPYDKGVIRPVASFLTLPHLLSQTLPFINADKTLAILRRTGLINDLDNRTGITFLAPDSSAIPSNIPDNVLAEILKRHVIVGLPVFTSDLKHGATYRTLAGTTVTVTVQCAEVFIGGARILAGDAIIKNGVAHTVDKLLETPILFTTTEVRTVTQTATKTDILTAEVTKTAIHTTEKTQTTTHTEEIVKTTTQTAEIVKTTTQIAETTHTTEKTKTQTETQIETTTHIQHPPPKPSTPCTTSTTYVPPPPPPPPPPPSQTSTPCTTTTIPPPPPPPPTTTPVTYTTLQTSHKPSMPHGPPPEVSTPCTTSTGKPGHW